MRTVHAVGSEFKQTRRIDRPLVFAIVMMICLVGAMGCSRFGSNGNLSQRRIPFPQQPLRQSSTPSDVAQATKSVAELTTNEVTKSLQKKAVDSRQSVENFRPRPPKLSDLPEAALFAQTKSDQPVIDNAAQAAFQQNSKDFNPAAEPPAQIFSQPVRESNRRSFSQPVTDGAANLQSSLATILPNNRVGESNRIDSSGTANDVSEKQPSSEFTNGSSATVTATRDQRDRSSQRILLLSDRSEAAGLASNIQQASAVEPAGVPAVKAIQGDFTKILTASSPLLPAPQVTSPTKVPYVEPPVDLIDARFKTTTAPKVDENLKGEVYSQSRPVKKTTPKEVPKISAVIDPKTNRGSQPVKENSVLSQLILEQTHNIGRDFKTDIAELKTPTLVQQDSGIKIDPSLGDQREELLNFSPQPIKKPEPATVVYQKKKAPFLMLPRISQTGTKINETRIASIKNNPIVAPWNRKDFEPVSKCSTCDGPDCHGCEIPPANQFAQSVPQIHSGRSLAPMAVEPNADHFPIERKNFGQVSFSSATLPLPQTVVGDADFIADTLGQEFIEQPVVVQSQNQSDVPPVGVDAVLKLNEVTWRSRLQQTIELVKDQLNNDIDSQTRTSMEVNLRLLDVLSRQMGDVAQEDRQFTESENQFWQHQLEAITSMLQTAELADVRDNDLLQHHTAHETLTHLRQAIAQLESLANLKISSGAFCTEVSGYGQFKLFPSDHFESGQKVLIYCEVENYSTIEHQNESQRTFHTKLRGSYAIYDSAGHAVQQAEFPVVEDVARRRRRDFYMHLPITIGDLAQGNYELHLLVEDLGGNKTASLTPPLAFRVAPKPQSNLQANFSSDSTLVR